ncbi:perlucin-like protein [Mercenaria mercenaria]|uniref:perlucin-like protein n=1 Tax=Mercenaria mercenaria TaxID=6596 RepID=UPI00234E9E88|nr:perlucin-like protein [Mercenaria mercenaria]
MVRLLVVVVYLSLTYGKVEADKWTLFQRKESLDGKMCKYTNFAFTNDSVHDKTVCLFECTNHVNCGSIFHVQHTGNCTGCTESYDIVSPTGLAAGSVYYGPASCTIGWLSIGSSRYCILDGIMNFENGVKNCESMKTHVVTVEDMDENNDLKSMINSMAFSGDVSAFYIGFTDVAVDGIWTEYGTTDEIGFKDWGPGEPNLGTSENCAALYVPYNLQWIDIGCNNELKIICEKET